MLSGLAIAALAVAMIALLPQAAHATSVSKTALLNEESVTLSDGIEKEGTPISLEQYAAERAGFTVTVANGATWETMTAEEFGKYQVLIVGDPKCSATALSADESAKTWVPVVMTPGNVGNRVVVGTDPEFHYAAGGGGAQPKEAGNPSTAGAEHLVQDGIAYAGGVTGATGIYFTTSCEDLEETAEEKEKHEKEGTARKISSSVAAAAQPGREGPDGRDKSEVLEHLTEAHTPNAWTENTSPPCGGSVQQVAFNSVFAEGESKLLDSDIQGWGCSDHITFPTFPADWFALAVATDTPEKPTCGTDPETKEEVCGEAYVLIAGRGIVAEAPNISLTPATGQSPAGGTHTVTANLHKEGNPVAEQVVTFALTGQNGGVTGTCTTGSGAPDPECKSDEAGNVSFTYTDVNGAGTDTIIASTTFETIITPPADRLAAVPTIKTTERASATQEWTPAPVTTPPPATTSTTPVTAVLAAKVVVPAKGTAKIASIRGCIARSSYLASVTGSSIAAVTFKLDGHTIKTLHKPTSGSTYSTRVPVHSGSAHHVTIHVVYTATSKTPATTLHQTVAHCAARRALPRFTG
jgi:hypothetical protein